MVNKIVLQDFIDLVTDASRRDLTINSIAFDSVTGEFIDPYGGRDDIKNKILRHTSAAFSEDPLRVIRLARFYARFDDFTIAPETIELARKVVDSGEMDSISFERYWVELTKVMHDNSPNIGRFLLALQTFGALSKCEFFKDVLGNCSWHVHLHAYTNIFGPNIAAVAKINPDLAVAVFVAIFEHRAPLSHKAVPTRVTRLVKNLRVSQSNTTTAENLYQIVAMTRSLSEPTEALTDLLVVQHILDDWRAVNIGVAQQMAASITAGAYMHLTGPEIGSAMKAARIAAISSVIQTTSEG